MFDNYSNQSISMKNGRDFKILEIVWWVGGGGGGGFLCIT